MRAKVQTPWSIALSSEARRPDACMRLGVERQHPIASAARDRPVLLRPVSWPVCRFDGGTHAFADGDGIVRAARIDDDDLIFPGDRLQACGDGILLVERDDRDR